jgi:excisionase family DNA binding protein
MTQGAMTARELALFLGVSVDTIYERVKAGRLPKPAMKGPYHRRLWSREQVSEIVSSLHRA